VTDASDKKALAAVRFLARAACRVSVTGSHRTDQSFYSKFAEGAIVTPNPAKDPDEWADFLLDYLTRDHFDAVLAMSDYTTLTLSRRQAEFEKVTGLAVPDWEVITVARDKPRVSEIASGLGIPVPAAWCPGTMAEVEKLAPELEYPVVVKYKRGTGAIGCRYAHNREELLLHYRTEVHRPDIVFDDVFPMIQEYIPGETRDVSVLFNRGEPLAALTSWRVKTWPPTGGRGVFNEVTHEPELMETVLRLLREIRYHGPAQVEFKRDLRDGSLKFIEVNTRFWGGLGFACEAGINFAHLTAQLAAFGEVEPQRDYEGVFYRWPFPLELKSVLHGPRAFEEFLEYLNRFRVRGMRYDVWPSDPLPHLVEWGMLAYVPLRRLVHRITGL
jgi:predicted ATP-grasp superfamily ATP-dependent carboligase